MKKRSKRYKDLEKKKNKGKISIEKAIELIKQTCNTKLKKTAII